eukprot:s2677_g3.t2
MDPGMPPDLLALSTCLDATHGASEVAQQLRVLSAQRGSAGRFHSEVAECLMRMKEIDGIAKVEQCRLSESGLTERSRIVEEARSQRYKHLVDVMQVSVKEDAETARQEITARVEVSKETVKGNVQIQESQARVEKSSSNFWQWAPKASGIPADSDGKRGKTPRNRWLNLLERLFRDLGQVSSRPRRDATYWGLVLGSLSLAVVSDFLGIMRLLLSLNPSGARQMGLDEVYPVEGLKTYCQRGRYRLRYPGEWLFDQSVAFSKQAAIELPTLRQKKRIVPDAAFGPAGGGLATTATAQNLSVVVQPVKAQRLEDLMGEPEEAFRKLAAETLAAEGSGRTAQLLSAERSARGSYELEYVVTYPDKEGSVDVHCWSVVALTLLGSSILTGRRRGSFRRGAGRLLGWLPWLLLALLGWRQTRATRFHLSQLMMLIRSPPLRRFLGLGSFFGGGAVPDTTESPTFTPASPLASASSEQSAPSMPRRPSRQDVDAATASERDSPIKGSAPSVPGSEEGEAAAALRRFLKPAGLDVYTDRLLAEGYDFEALTMLEGTEREEMLRIVQCLPGHKVKFRKLLWRSQS